MPVLSVSLCFTSPIYTLWAGRVVIMHRVNELRRANRENENTCSEITRNLVLE